MRVRLPYAARCDPMPVGGSRREVMTMRFVSDDPRLRLFDGRADHRRRPSAYGWLMRTASRRRGRRESDEAYPPSAGKVSWNAGDRVPCQPTHRPWERSRGGAWAPQPVILVMPHAAACASTAGMGAGIRHEWPDRLWTARTYPCRFPAHAFVAQPVEAMRQGRIRSGFESRRKHQRKQRRQRHPIRFERLPERERCYGRFSP